MTDTKPSTDEAKEQTTTAPIFGAASTFGAGGGFAAFTGAPKADDADGEAADGEEATPEEECKAEFKPVVQLDEVETTTGEEGENLVADFKCKLYRFDADAGEWKERGVGQARLLEHKDNKKIRLLMRQEKTLKIRANHIVMPGTKLQEHSGSDKAWVWSTVDFAEEEQKMELFCMRFANADRAKEFKVKYEEAMDVNEKLLANDEAAAAAEAKPDETEALADKVKESVKVEDKE